MNVFKFYEKCEKTTNKLYRDNFIQKHYISIKIGILLYFILGKLSINRIFNHFRRKTDIKIYFNVNVENINKWVLRMRSV